MLIHELNRDPFIKISSRVTDLPLIIEYLNILNSYFASRCNITKKSLTHDFLFISIIRDLKRSEEVECTVSI